MDDYGIAGVLGALITGVLLAMTVLIVPQIAKHGGAEMSTPQVLFCGVLLTALLLSLGMTIAVIA